MNAPTKIQTPKSDTPNVPSPRKRAAQSDIHELRLAPSSNPPRGSLTVQTALAAVRVVPFTAPRTYCDALETYRGLPVQERARPLPINDDAELLQVEAVRERIARYDGQTFAQRAFDILGDLLEHDAVARSVLRIIYEDDVVDSRDIARKLGIPVEAVDQARSRMLALRAQVLALVAAL